MAISGVGTKFLKSDMASSPVYSEIADINDIDGPNKTRKTINTTALGTTGGYETFIAGFRDGGTVTMNMNFTNTGYDAMNDDFESDVVKDYEIRLPDTAKTSLKFSGLVTDLGMKIPKDDKVSAPVTIKVTGAITLTVWV